MDPLHTLKNIETKVRKVAQRMARLEHENQTLRKQNTELATELAEAQQRLSNIHATLAELRRKWKKGKGGAPARGDWTSEEINDLWADLDNCFEWSQTHKDGDG